MFVDKLFSPWLRGDENETIIRSINDKRKKIKTLPKNSLFPSIKNETKCYCRLLYTPLLSELPCVRLPNQELKSPNRSFAVGTNHCTGHLVFCPQLSESWCECLWHEVYSLVSLHDTGQTKGSTDLHQFSDYQLIFGGVQGYHFWKSCCISPMRGSDFCTAANCSLPVFKGIS